MIAIFVNMNKLFYIFRTNLDNLKVEIQSNIERLGWFLAITYNIPTLYIFILFIQKEGKLITLCRDGQCIDRRYKV